MYEVMTVCFEKLIFLDQFAGSEYKIYRRRVIEVFTHNVVGKVSSWAG